MKHSDLCHVFTQVAATDVTYAPGRVFVASQRKPAALRFLVSTTCIILKHISAKSPQVGRALCPLRRAYKYRYMQTSACMHWNKRVACFYCSTSFFFLFFCPFALISLSPEGHDSSVSGEISCMIEQRSTRNGTELGLTVPPAEQVKEARRRGLCIYVCVCGGRWRW